MKNGGTVAATKLNLLSRLFYWSIVNLNMFVIITMIILITVIIMTTLVVAVIYIY